MWKKLRDLYEGNILPSEQGRPKTEEYSVLQKNFIKHREEFKDKIGSHFNDELQKLMDEQLDIFALELTQTFIDGFRLGAKMIIEVFEENPPYE